MVLLASLLLLPKLLSPPASDDTNATADEHAAPEILTNDAFEAGPEAGMAPSGKWYRDRRHARGQLSVEQRAEMKALEAIGYASGTQAAGTETGVTVLDPERAQPGLNFYVSGHGPEAVLMALGGRELHRWRCASSRAWPDRDSPGQGYWRRARLLESGEVLVIFGNVGLIKLDRDSNLLWTYAGQSHHALDVDEAGRIFVLERVAVMAPWLHPDRPVLDDLITVLSPEGELLRQISLLDCIARSPLRESLEEQLRNNYARNLLREEAVRLEHRELIARNPEQARQLDMAGDIFHTNQLQLLDGSLAKKSPHFRRGNVLISIRNLGRVAVIDPRTQSLAWSLSGSWKGQHEPVMLDTGRLILFDNHGPDARGEKGFSEILELEPLTGEVAWSYKGERPFEFYSHIAGTCQRLANGNTLITESVTGRAFEVTPAKEIVWEFFNPHRAGASDELIAFLPDLQRVPFEFVADWLEEARDKR